MHIHAALFNYPPGSMVGAWITTHEFLAHMVKRGHRVTVDRILVTNRRERGAYKIDGVEVLSENGIPRTAEVVVSHLGDRGAASEEARSRGIPSVRMIHGQEQLMHTRLNDTLAVFNSHSLATHVICNGWFGDYIVCHPPVSPEQYRTTPGSAITLVNLSSQKGGNLFWRVATAMPDVEFIGVRGGYGRQILRDLRDYPNVTLLDPVTDMRPIYARTRILMMPSAKETWGRVAVEGMASGIPTIAHPVPGLVESLGRAGTFADRQNPRQWVDAIRTMDWDKMSERSLKRSAELDPVTSLETFAEAVEAL